MSTTPDPARIEAAIDTLVQRLLAEMHPEGFWEGFLSSSALSTATAISALSLANDPTDIPLISAGCAWLCATQNPDGGWGDTPDSPSNLSTTLLALSALHLAAPITAPHLDERTSPRSTGVPPVSCALETREAKRTHSTAPQHGREDRATGEPVATTTSGMGAPPMRPSPSPGTPGEGRGEGAFPPLPLGKGWGEGPRGNREERQRSALDRAALYVASHAGPTPSDIVRAITRIYGQDRTFAVPILMTCALADLVPWNQVPALPFELAAVPKSWYKALRLQVVSYALPALIAIGLLIHRRHPPRNPLRRLLRSAATGRALSILHQIQPLNGGFLEATPLTSFVALGLLPLTAEKTPDHFSKGSGVFSAAVASRCLTFLRASQRPDGSWPIDSNLSVWLTTATVAALNEAGQLARMDRTNTADWIAARQHRAPHPYTNAAPGAWAWTHLPGGVPDADDTSGALIALAELGHHDGIAEGVRWLLNVQNSDGGWPTFCRGWGKLPFDRSSPDVTAHALRALHRATSVASTDPHNPRITRAIARGIRYLQDTQQPDGSWLPLWFGSQSHPTHANPVLGTARVLRALHDLGVSQMPIAIRAVAYLLAAQSPAGGWGAARDLPPTVEETALAVSALCPCNPSDAIAAALSAGVGYLLQAIDDGRVTQPSPIGLYFASLWYSERLYPLIWTLEALGRCARVALGHPRTTPAAANA